MQNGVWDPSLLERIEPAGDYLLVNPATDRIGYAGWQWVAIGLAAEIRAMAREFRAATGKALYITEAFRSYDTQVAYFEERYVRSSSGTVVWKGQSYVKRAGASTAAVPGTSPHGLGLADDLASGIQISFTSSEHVIFEEIAKKHGWTNTGRNFGEPWHFEKTGTSTVDPSSGGTTTPVEEDDMYTDADRDRDKAAATDAAAARANSNQANERAGKTLDQARANGEAIAAVQASINRVLALDSNGLSQLNDRAGKAASRAQDILDTLAKK